MTQLRTTILAYLKEIRHPSGDEPAQVSVSSTVLANELQADIHAVRAALGDLANTGDVRLLYADRVLTPDTDVWVHLTRSTSPAEGRRLGALVLTREDVYSWALQLGLPPLSSESYSAVFVGQLAAWNDHNPEVARRIVSEVRALEGLGNRTETKAPTRFRHLPLRGLFHKHFLTEDFVFQNVAVEWGAAHGGNAKIDALIKEVLGKYAGDFRDPRLAAELAHRIVHEGLQSRSEQRRMTGEWIIFAQEDNKRTYLVISNHSDDPWECVAAIRRGSFPGQYDHLFSADDGAE